MVFIGDHRRDVPDTVCVIVFNLDQVEWRPFIVLNIEDPMHKPMMLEFRSFFPGQEHPSNVLRLCTRINSPWETVQDINRYADRVQQHMKANGGIFPDFGSEEWR